MLCAHHSQICIISDCCCAVQQGQPVKLGERRHACYNSVRSHRAGPEHAPWHLPTPGAEQGGAGTRPASPGLNGPPRPQWLCAYKGDALVADAPSVAHQPRRLRERHGVPILRTLHPHLLEDQELQPVARDDYANRSHGVEGHIACASELTE